MKTANRILLIFLMLAVSLCGMGVAYAAWNDGLLVRGELSTGSFSIGKNASNGYSLWITDSKGTVLEEMPSGYEVTHISGGDPILLIRDLVWTQALLEKEGHMLLLTGSLESDTGSTLLGVASRQADFSRYDDIVRANPGRASLEIGDTRIPLTGESRTIAPAITFEVFYQIMVEGGHSSFQIYLKPQSMPRDMQDEPYLVDWADLPQQMAEALTEESLGGEDVTLIAELRIPYSIQVPLYIEQMH